MAILRLARPRVVRVLVLALTLAPFAGAAAQRNCKTGVPCGGTCIAAGKTCHVGSPVASPKQDSVRASAASAPAPLQASNATTLPPPVGNYSDFVNALRPWLMKRVVIRNSAGDERALRDAALTDIKPDHLVLTAGSSHILIPITSIEMVYYDNPPSLSESAVTIVMRR